MTNKIHIVASLSFVLFLWSCGSVPKFTIKDNPKPNKKENESPRYGESENTADDNPDVTEFHNVTILETVTGVASFYGEDFHGNQTSNGEIYDMYGISAAHPTYPEDTIVRVTHLGNGKSTIVRINDRMPVHPDRVIDLSYGTAEKLDMIQEGLAEVKIEVLKWGEGEYKKN